MHVDDVDDDVFVDVDDDDDVDDDVDVDVDDDDDFHNRCGC